MLTVEGYKMFKGAMRIGTKMISGTWLYKPDTQCWYCAGSSYPEEVCAPATNVHEVLDVCLKTGHDFWCNSNLSSISIGRVENDEYKYLPIHNNPYGSQLIDMCDVDTLKLCVDMLKEATNES